MPLRHSFLTQTWSPDLIGAWVDGKLRVLQGQIIHAAPLELARGFGTERWWSDNWQSHRIQVFTCGKKKVFHLVELVLVKGKQHVGDSSHAYECFACMHGICCLTLLPPRLGHHGGSYPPIVSTNKPSLKLHLSGICHSNKQQIHWLFSASRPLRFPRHKFCFLLNRCWLIRQVLDLSNHICVLSM